MGHIRIVYVSSVDCIYRVDGCMVKRIRRDGHSCGQKLPLDRVLSARRCNVEASRLISQVKVAAMVMNCW